LSRTGAWYALEEAAMDLITRYKQVVKSILYHYPPLPRGNDNIHLLRLILNKNETAIIKYQLFNYSLEPDKSTHLYNTLSYV
jgi:hypothetical protein